MGGAPLAFIYYFLEWFDTNAFPDMIPYIQRAYSEEGLEMVLGREEVNAHVVDGSSLSPK